MKTPLTLLLLLAPLRLLAPQPYQGIIIKQNGLNPFENTFRAVCHVESNNNPMAYNQAENAIGIAQIRPAKVSDYNRSTHSNIQHTDCYNPEISRRIFMWHMSHYGAANTDLAIRRWNGSGTATHQYLKKVKKMMI